MLACSLATCARICLLQRQEKHEEAIVYFKEALVVFEEAFPSGHWLIPLAQGNRGTSLAELGNYQEAEEELIASYEGLSSELGPDHRRTQATLKRLVELYEAWGKPSKAAEYKELIQVDPDSD